MIRILPTAVVVLLGFACALVGPEPALSQVVEPYLEGPDSGLGEEYQWSGDGRSIFIWRNGPSPVLLKMISRAEALYPSAEQVRHVRDSLLATAPGHELLAGTGEIPTGPSSWLGNVHGAPLPFAVTGEAIGSYVAWTEAGEGFPFGGEGVELTYIAEARQIGEREARFRVRMVLMLEWGCQPECTSSITKGREVFLDEDGRLVRVTGDGLAGVEVGMP